MQVFFESQKKRDALFSELSGWVGTPFRHRAGVKGLGADCSHFVAAVLNAAGYKVAFVWPDYPPDWNLHLSKEVLLDGVMRQITAEVVTHNKLMDGDLLFFRFGKAMGHMAIFCRGKIYHAAYRIGVVAETYPDKMWSKRLGAALRITR